MGLAFGSHSYLADPFNYLDLFVVILGMLDLIPAGHPICAVAWPPPDAGESSLSALRALRVLRPLRAVTKFPELKQLVVS
jgi:voltage-dependent calcium channel T type alpha-1H